MLQLPVSILPDLKVLESYPNPIESTSALVQIFMHLVVEECEEVVKTALMIKVEELIKEGVWPEC